MMLRTTLPLILLATLSLGLSKLHSDQGREEQVPFGLIAREAVEQRGQFLWAQRQVLEVPKLNKRDFDSLRAFLAGQAVDEEHGRHRLETWEPAAHLIEKLVKRAKGGGRTSSPPKSGNAGSPQGSGGASKGASGSGASSTGGSPPLQRPATPATPQEKAGTAGNDPSKGEASSAGPRTPPPLPPKPLSRQNTDEGIKTAPGDEASRPGSAPPPPPLPGSGSQPGPSAGGPQQAKPPSPPRPDKPAHLQNPTAPPVPNKPEHLQDPDKKSDHHEGILPDETRRKDPEDHRKTGQKINELMDERLKKGTDAKNPAEEKQKFQQNYNTIDGNTNKPPGRSGYQKEGPPRTLKGSMKDANLPVGDDYSRVKVHSVKDPEKPSEPMPEDMLGGPRRGAVADRLHAPQAAIGHELDSKNDAMRRPGGDAKQSLPGSEILYQAQNQVHPGSTATMKAYAESEITNPDTKRTINDVHEGKPGWQTTPRPGDGASQGLKDKYNKLLGTDNFKGPARMVADHAATGPGKPESIKTYNPPVQQGPEGKGEKPGGIMHFPGTGNAAEGGAEPSGAGPSGKQMARRGLRLQRRVPLKNLYGVTPIAVY